MFQQHVDDLNDHLFVVSVNICLCATTGDWFSLYNATTKINTNFINIKYDEH